MVLIRVEFFLVLAFILDKTWVVFSIVRILLLVNRVDPAPVFPVAMRMIHLRLTCLEETPSQFREAVRCTNVYVKGIELMGDTLAGLGQPQLVALDFIRRPYKYSEVFRHFSFYRYPKIEVYSFFDCTFIKVASKAVSTNIGIHHEEIFIIPIDGPSYHTEVFLKIKAGKIRRETANLITIMGGAKRAH